MTDPVHVHLPDGRRIATRFQPGEGPAIVFLPGYMSDMAGGKATALAQWAGANGRAMLRLDYSGCGESEGDFADGTLSRWREDVLAAIDRHCPDRSILLVGSSMGGWLMLLVGLALDTRLAGVVGIAAAPDFIRWGYSEEQRARLAAGETVLEDNPYGPDPTPTYPGLYADAQRWLMLDAPIAIDAPARLLHGQADADVPHTISLRLAERLAGHDIVTTLIKDGDHRLSRPSDIARLIDAVETIR